MLTLIFTFNSEALTLTNCQASDQNHMMIATAYEFSMIKSNGTLVTFVGIGEAVEDSSQDAITKCVKAGFQKSGCSIQAYNGGDFIHTDRFAGIIAKKYGCGSYFSDVLGRYVNVK